MEQSMYGVSVPTLRYGHAGSTLKLGIHPIQPTDMSVQLKVAFLIRAEFLSLPSFLPLRIETRTLNTSQTISGDTSTS
jgi:hypothetical protein